MTTFEPLRTEPATLGHSTPATRTLRVLPPPAEKVYVAVYKFRDQTGQYKPSSVGTSFSTAVTQGATSILIKALEESGWFIPVEREGLSNLLNERKIIRSSRAGFRSGEDNNGDAPMLPPLLFAGIVIEGGVVAYETNVLTGGAGARYFGVGASGQYRQDRVTVYLRAVSTQNGRILKTVHTTKTILSQMIDANLFKFVDFQRLAEAEVGYSSNEPPQICVTEAIEKAVQALVIEGVFDNLWALKNPGDIDGTVFRGYRQEKVLAHRMDVFEISANQHARLSVGLYGSLSLYSGDYARAAWKEGVGIGARYFAMEKVGLEVTAGLSSLKASGSFESEGTVAVVSAVILPFGRYGVSPYVFGGGGLYFAGGEFTSPISEPAEMIPLLNGGAGILFEIVSGVALDVRYGIHYYLDDSLDGAAHGSYNDYTWSWSSGIQYYFGR